MSSPCDAVRDSEITISDPAELDSGAASGLLSERGGVAEFARWWQSEWGPQRSRVSSLSPTGCYVEDRFTVPPSGEFVPELTVNLPGGQICVQGMVMDAMPGIGFAVRFTQVDADPQSRLRAAVHELQQLHPPF